MTGLGVLIRTQRRRRRLWSGLTLTILVITTIGAERLPENHGFIALALVFLSIVVGYTLADQKAKRQTEAEQHAQAENPFTVSGYGKSADDFNIV